MARLSSWLFLSFNLLALASGCFAIGSYLYFQANGITDCKHVVQKPILIMGISLIVISSIGLIGAVFKLTCLLWFYSFIALMVLVALTAFSALVYMIDNLNSRDHELSGLGFKKHSIGGHYKQWLKNMVANGRQWNGIRTCLIEHQVCKRLQKKNLIQKAGDLFANKLSPIESGCCKPPKYCGFEYKNATFWAAPKSDPTIQKRDCISWSNHDNRLCYNCDSCKSGVIQETKKIWRVFSILDFLDIAILLVMFFLSSCARNHILSDTKYNRIYP